MDYNKLLALLDDAHTEYRIAVADATRTHEGWVLGATDAKDADILYADNRRSERIRSAHDSLMLVHPHVGLPCAPRDLPAFIEYQSECDAAYDEHSERDRAAREHYDETLRYAYQWYMAAVKGAASDFNLKLIRAMEEAGK